MCGIVGFTNNIDNTDEVLGKMMMINNMQNKLFCCCKILCFVV